MRRIPLYGQIFIGMIAGGAIGIALGKEASPLGEPGKAVIQLIKILAVPLLFLAILDAFLKTRIEKRAALRLVQISAINAVAAITIGLSISNFIQPGTHMRLESLSAASTPTSQFAGKKIDFMKTLAGYIPESLVHPFSENSIITVILLALLIGAALRKLKDESTEGLETVEGGIHALYRASETMIGWVTRLIPFAVFCVVAKTVGENGFAPLRGLAIYLVVALAGLLTQIGVVYQAWLLLSRAMPLRRFWSGAKDAVFYALGASSSLATLPVTLKSLERMGVSSQSARLSACVGTNLNNDGILLYEAMAVLFVAQVHGIDLTLPQQLLAAVSCVVAGIGIAGIPDAGLISLALVLATVGLPVEILPLLLTVDWVLSRARATTNVISDMVNAVLLDRFKSR